MIANEFGLLIWTHVAMVALPALIALMYVNIPSDIEEKQIFLNPQFDVEHSAAAIPARVA